MKKQLKNNEKKLKLTTFGFTLIELLAVIIILSIVALIATPIILDVVEDARISSGKSESNMIYSGINNYCASINMKKQMGTLDSSDIDCTTKTTFTNEELSKMVNLGNAKVDKVTYDGNKLTELIITSNNHKFTLCPSGTFVMDDEKCENEIGVISIPIIEKVKELVYENNACKTDGSTYQYMGGCYIKGTREEINNNYVWYSGFLWRIMGINADGTVKMISEDNVTAISWGKENIAENWDESYVNDWLNNYFYPKLKGNNIIKEETWCSEATIDSLSARTECTNNISKEKAKVGLITLDEHNLAGGSTSYLYITQIQWTMTPYTNSPKIWRTNIKYGDNVSSEFSQGLALRPIININSDVTITGGNGILKSIWSNQSGPYILNEDKSVEVTGKLNEKATSGEYVLFANKKYRVVDKDSNGNIKLILDGYYEENGNIFGMEYGDDNTFSIDTGIGQKLNGDVLNWLTNNDESEKEKLVTNYTWYQKAFNHSDSYKVSIDEENPTRRIKATVGLIRVGEMLSTQSSSILTNGYTVANNYENAKHYWTITPSTTSYMAYDIINYDYCHNDGVSNTLSLRPVIVINSDVTITGGNGTWSNPYKI